MPRATLRTAAADATRARIRSLALEQLAAGGPQALSLNALAAALPMSGPAVYRYYRGRDDLLTDLVAEAYADLAAAVGRPADLTGFVAAYRAWGTTQPHRYRLLYGPPLPGYDAHAAVLVEASQQVMNALLARLAGLTVRPVPGLAAPQLAAWSAARGMAVDPEVAGVALSVWSRVHGLVSLEINGDFASVGVDPAGLYDDVAPSVTLGG